MERLLCAIMAVTMLIAASFAVSAATIGGLGDVTIGAGGSYEAPVPEDVYEIDVSFGRMQFDYFPGGEKWDPYSHKWLPDATKPAGWTVNENSNTISLRNHSSQAVYADFSFAADPGCESVGGNFFRDGVLLEGEIELERPQADVPAREYVVSFMPNGVLPLSYAENIFYSTFGKITVSLDSAAVDKYMPTAVTELYNGAETVHKLSDLFTYKTDCGVAPDYASVSVDLIKHDANDTVALAAVNRAATVNSLDDITLTFTGNGKASIVIRDSLSCKSAVITVDVKDRYLGLLNVQTDSDTYTINCDGMLNPQVTGVFGSKSVALAPEQYTMDALDVETTGHYKVVSGKPITVSATAYYDNLLEKVVAGESEYALTRTKTVTVNVNEVVLDLASISVSPASTSMDYGYTGKPNVSVTANFSGAYELSAEVPAENVSFSNYSSTVVGTDTDATASVTGQYKLSTGTVDYTVGNTRTATFTVTVGNKVYTLTDLKISGQNQDYGSTTKPTVTGVFTYGNETKEMQLDLSKITYNYNTSQKAGNYTGSASVQAQYVVYEGGEGVSYGAGSTVKKDFNYTVNEIKYALNSIKLNRGNTSIDCVTTYNESTVRNGLTVTGVFSDGKERTLGTYAVDMGGMDTSKLGTYTITISAQAEYRVSEGQIVFAAGNTKAASYTVKVNEVNDNLTAITNLSAFTVNISRYNTSTNLTNLIKSKLPSNLSLKFNDDETHNVSRDKATISVGNYNANTVGTYTATVKVQAYKVRSTDSIVYNSGATVTVNVTVRVVGELGTDDMIVLTAMPGATQYFALDIPDWAYANSGINYLLQYEVMLSSDAGKGMGALNPQRAEGGTIRDLGGNTPASTNINSSGNPQNYSCHPGTDLSTIKGIKDGFVTMSYGLLNYQGTYTHLIFACDNASSGGVAYYRNIRIVDSTNGQVKWTLDLTKESHEYQFSNHAGTAFSGTDHSQLTHAFITHTAAGPAVNTTPSGWTFVDDTALSVSGNYNVGVKETETQWQRESNGGAHLRNQTRLHHTGMGHGAKVSYTFTGTGFAWLTGFRDNATEHIPASVKITITNYDGNGTTKTFYAYGNAGGSTVRTPYADDQTVMFETLGMASVSHTVTIETISGGACSIDTFAIVQ